MRVIDIDAIREAGIESIPVVVVEGNPLIDEATDYITYIGYAPVGVKPTENKWRIQRITTECTVPEDYPTSPITDIGTGTNTIIEYADGDYNSQNIWNDRESLIYRR